MDSWANLRRKQKCNKFYSKDIEQVISYLKQELKLGNGEGSLRGQLESVQRQTGKTPKELEDLIELPDSIKYIWKYFIDLDRKRSNTGYGPLALQYSEILAYFNLFNIDYESIEIEILMLMDDTAMAYYNEKIKEENSKK